MLQEGKVSFTDLEMSLTGTEYRLAVFSYIIDPYTHRVERWEYVTAFFDVYPPAPMVTRVDFSPGFNQV